MKNTKELKNIYTEIKTKQWIPHVRREKFRVQNKAKQSKAKMYHGRRHVPLCPAIDVDVDVDVVDLREQADAASNNNVNYTIYSNF